jgi:RND family efflux transporter MFP subunit
MMKFFTRESIGGFATLLALIAVGYQGHHTGWTFLPQAHGADHGDATTAGHDSASPTAEKAVSTSAEADVSGPAVASAIRLNVEDAKRSGVEMTQVVTRHLVEEVCGNGVVTYDQRAVARVGARVSGTVWKVDRYWGDMVKQGDVLALVESTDVGTRKTEFLRTLALVESKEAHWKNLEQIGSAVAARVLREAKLSLREARIALLDAEQSLVNLGFSITREEFQGLSEEEQATKIRFLGLPEGLLSQLDPKKTTSNLVPIFAPFDGQVIGRDVGIGETVEPGSRLFEIADIRKMWIKIDVRKEEASRIAVGQAMHFHVDGTLQEISCKIDWISTEVNEGTRTLQARANVENLASAADPSAQVLRANAFGTARIRVREAEGTCMVAKEAVQMLNGKSVVFLMTPDQHIECREVECGFTSDGFVEISGDLRPGDMVAGKGSHVLKSEYLLAAAN